MPAVKKDRQTPCDDWEKQEYDDPLIISPSSTDPKNDEIHLSSRDPSASSNLASNTSLDPVELENTEIWNNANRTPKYVVLPANASHSAVTANRSLVQDTMFGKTKVTILKRPKAEVSSNNSTSSSTSSSVSVSLREKSYLAARERIFGSSSPSSDDPTSSKPFKSNHSQTLLEHHSETDSVTIERQPNGPVALDQKGFSNRRKSASNQVALV